ncbi:type II toxin-antitoxin system prevent-host-death family antitoxin [Ferriphaselus sp. R-1]|uniref:type II toxin-antitoxin system prevent-host-death family antitoxin n=1 Tax=Ferriphaselus sp. R-1 TaxID=1485544 RepID=UPI00054E2387|nr:type II toxin-antitoxin system prevent-host-death family antitoxin [Ferriphaselus sp. R-1]
MNAIHAAISIGVTELRESPTRILKRAEDEDQAVAILNHNKPAGYIVSPRMMEAMLDSIADRVADTRAKNRLATLNTARRVTLDEL